MKLISAYIFCFYFCLSLMAQDKAIISNSRMQPLMYNPSFVGDNDMINISALARQQWVGFGNAPSTQVFAMDMFLKTYSSGVGVVVQSDAIGHEKALNFKINYCYRVYLGDYWVISSGLGFGAVNKSFNFNTLVYEKEDPDGAMPSFSTMMPEFSTGIKVDYQDYTFGFSYVKLFDNSNDDVEVFIPDFYCYYINGLFEIDRDNDMMAYAMVNTALKSYNINVGAQLIMKKNTWFGLSYRYRESFTGLVGYRLNQNLMIEYSYDFSSGGLRKYNVGSHELYLRLSLKKPEKKYFYYKSPRFF